MLIPIGTEIRTPRVPAGNYLLIGLNVLVFLVTDVLTGGTPQSLGTALKAWFALDAARPSLYQYLTYQFLHGDILHLAGNMLFLWIFGNAVCDRMGSLPYLLFYLAGGVFAGFAFTLEAENPIVGASGAIAAVTTAFLALFPRVHITMLAWMFFIFTFQVPAMILIVFKIILWDNILAPSFYAANAYSNVAYSAHLGGYAFGFLMCMILLAIRALPRSQFDLAALWTRAGRRYGFSAGGGSGGERVVGGRPIRVEELDSRPLEEVELTPVERLREETALHLAERDPQAAIESYLRLMQLDATQVLSATHQLEIANYLAQQRYHTEAANAYEAFLGAYPAASDAAEVRLLLGLIYSRYLQQDEQAVRHLRSALDDLRTAAQRSLAQDELQRAEARISGPSAEEGPEAADER